MISDKLLVLFNVDLDEGRINTYVDEALKAEKFSTEISGLVAVLVYLHPGLLMLSSTLS